MKWVSYMKTFVIEIYAFYGEIGIQLADREVVSTIAAARGWKDNMMVICAFYGVVGIQFADGEVDRITAAGRGWRNN